MDIRPIKTEADHAAAVAEIERLIDAVPGTEEADRLDVLTTLVDDSEDRHHPIEAPDPVSAILLRMEQGGLTRKDPDPASGSRARHPAPPAPQPSPTPPH